MTALVEKVSGDITASQLGSEETAVLADGVVVECSNPVRTVTISPPALQNIFFAAEAIAGIYTDDYVFLRSVSAGSWVYHRASIDRDINGNVAFTYGGMNPTAIMIGRIVNGELTANYNFYHPAAGVWAVGNNPTPPNIYSQYVRFDATGTLCYVMIQGWGLGGILDWHQWLYKFSNITGEEISHIEFEGSGYVMDLDENGNLYMGYMTPHPEEEYIRKYDADLNLLDAFSWANTVPFYAVWADPEIDLLVTGGYAHSGETALCLCKKDGSDSKLIKSTTGVAYPILGARRIGDYIYAGGSRRVTFAGQYGSVFKFDLDGNCLAANSVAGSTTYLWSDPDGNVCVKDTTPGVNGVRTYNPDDLSLIATSGPVSGGPSLTEAREVVQRPKWPPASPTDYNYYDRYWNTIHVGIPYKSKLSPMRPEIWK